MIWPLRIKRRNGQMTIKSQERWGVGLLLFGLLGSFSYRFGRGRPSDEDAGLMWCPKQSEALALKDRASWKGNESIFNLLPLARPNGLGLREASRSMIEKGIVQRPCQIQYIPLFIYDVKQLAKKASSI